MKLKQKNDELIYKSTEMYKNNAQYAWKKRLYE